MCDLTTAPDPDVTEEPIAPELVGRLEKMVSLVSQVEHKIDQLRHNLIGCVPSRPECEHKVKEPECFMEVISQLNVEAQYRLADVDEVLDVLLHHFPDSGAKKVAE